MEKPLREGHNHVATRSMLHGVNPSRGSFWTSSDEQVDEIPGPRVDELRKRRLSQRVKMRASRGASSRKLQEPQVGLLPRRAGKGGCLAPGFDVGVLSVEEVVNVPQGCTNMVVKGVYAGCKGRGT